MLSLHFDLQLHFVFGTPTARNIGRSVPWKFHLPRKKERKKENSLIYILYLLFKNLILLLVSEIRNHLNINFGDLKMSYGAKRCFFQNSNDSNKFVLTSLSSFWPRISWLQNFTAENEIGINRTKEYFGKVKFKFTSFEEILSGFLKVNKWCRTRAHISGILYVNWWCQLS